MSGWPPPPKPLGRARRCSFCSGRPVAFALNIQRQPVLSALFAALRSVQLPPAWSESKTALAPN